MFKEYALDPGVLSSWDRVRYFLDAMGPWKGRFLACYPKHWKRLLYESLSCPPIEKKRIEQRLAGLDSRVFSPRSGSEYSGHESWRCNAEREHERKPFAGIISQYSDPLGVHIDAETVDETDFRWSVGSSVLVDRHHEDFGAALSLLMALSSSVVVVDPYFRPDQDDKWSAITAILSHTPPGTCLEVHSSDEHFGTSEFVRALRRRAKDGHSLGAKFFRWTEPPFRFHNRYVLTELAGVQFGDGIESGERGHEDCLSILPDRERASMMKQFTDVGRPPSIVW